MSLSLKSHHAAITCWLLSQTTLYDHLSKDIGHAHNEPLVKHLLKHCANKSQFPHKYPSNNTEHKWTLLWCNALISTTQCLHTTRLNVKNIWLQSTGCITTALGVIYIVSTSILLNVEKTVPSCVILSFSASWSELLGCEEGESGEKRSS